MKLANWKQGISKRRFELLVILAVGLACVCGSAAASDIYSWTDENGVVHYGDTPPETGHAKKIDVQEAYRPGTTDAYPLSDDHQDSPAVETEEATEENPEDSVKSAAQQRREEIARDRQERNQEQAELDLMCSRHKQRLEQVEPARRVFYTNEQGESVRMDDDTRIGLVEESRSFIDKNCG